LVVPLEEDDVSYPNKRAKIILYVGAVFSAFAVMTALKHLFGGGLGLPRFEAVGFDSIQLLGILPLALVGTLMGLLYHSFKKLTRVISLTKLFKNRPVLKAVICGLVLGSVGIVLPYTMFAGEEQMTLLTSSWSNTAVWILIATGIVKLLIIPFCINMGWRGGNIFPLIFCGVSVGYGIATISGIDSVLCVTVIVASLCGAAMRQPLAVIALLFLCFPISDILFLGAGAFIGSVIPVPKSLLENDT
jgi:H+/Cl- antiporter ClcA